MKPFISLFLVILGGFVVPVPAAAQQLQKIEIPNYMSFYQPQETASWCWAACNCMVLNAQGIPQNQKEQATKLFGAPIPQGAGGDFEKAKTALAGTYVTSSGQNVTINTYISYVRDNNADDQQRIIDSLNRGVPVITANKQHGRVIVGASYLQINGQVHITALRLLDSDHSFNQQIPKTYVVPIQAMANEFGFMITTP